MADNGDTDMQDAAGADVVAVDPEAAEPSDAAASAAAADLVADGDAAAATGDQEEQPAEKVPPEVDAELLSQLKEMGFGHERSVRALHFSGNSSLEGAINWLEEHADDADLDEVLLVEKHAAKEKKKLTPEEAKARAAELQARAKAKREAAEQVNSKDSEKLRIQMGKELAAAQRAEEEGRLKRAADVRRMEKEADAKAKAKIQAKLDEDRRERRRKLGLPEELTEEEQAAERAKAEAAAVEAARKRLPVKPVSRIAKMRDLLVAMKKDCGDEAAFKTCCKTLNAYCRNVYKDLSDESKRRIKLDNKALCERVTPMPGGLDFLAQVGFQEQEGYLVMPKGEDKFEKAVLEGAADVVDSALNNPMFGAL